MRIMTSEVNMKSKLFRSSVVTTFVLLLIACALPVIVAAQAKPRRQPLHRDRKHSTLPSRLRTQ